ncbi:hypothetical protein ACFSKL_15690 [Belliella marina]|uniref:Methyltransferase domain-containing protein n=1 Tax=Belliella marina TaxID=1644146 RepID=A0ABW4VRN4_9BACT
MANQVRRKQLEQLGVEFNEEEFLFHLVLLREGYLDDRELEQMEIWLNRLIESNHRAMIYDEECFYSFCENLALKCLKNNKLGEWSIEKGLLNHIFKILAQGKSILEFGSGKGTEALLKKYSVISIEHNPKFAFKRGEGHQCIYAPIEGEWYKVDDVRRTLESESYDLILIDGPSGGFRNGILKSISLFEHVKCPIIFDDVNRKEDMEIMKLFCEKLNLAFSIFKGREKDFSICFSAT